MATMLGDVMIHTPHVWLFSVSSITTIRFYRRYRSQGSTGVLKTSRLPTWIVNFGVGFAHPKNSAGCGFAWAAHLAKFSVRASEFFWDMQLLNALQQAYLVAKTKVQRCLQTQCSLYTVIIVTTNHLCVHVLKHKLINSCLIIIN